MRGSRVRSFWFAAVAVGALSAAACGPTKDFIWVDQVPSGMNATDTTYRISPGDVIAIRVWGQEANSVDHARVRDDGKVTMPFLNDVEVAGMEPTDLARRLQVKLKAYIVSPVVTVIIQERHPLRVSVVGRVTRPGVYDLDREAGVVQAIAAAGGLTDFAHGDRIFVLRNGFWADRPGVARIRFRYDDLKSGKEPASMFRLRRGDVVVVE